MCPIQLLYVFCNNFKGLVKHTIEMSFFCCGLVRLDLTLFQIFGLVSLELFMFESGQ